MNGLFLEYPEVPTLVKTHSIVVMRMGSFVYGASKAASDHDAYAVVVPPTNQLNPLQDRYIGFGARPYVFDTWQKPDLKPATGEGVSYDLSAYSVVKYFQLVADANPNMVDSLFVPPEHWMDAFPAWYCVYNHRHLFLSKRLFPRYFGYANSNRHKLIDKETQGKRKTTIDEYGYDVKAAYHLYRLISEAVQIAKENTLVLNMPERSQVMLDIRAGKYPLADFQDMMEGLEQELKQAEQASALPDDVNWKALNELLWQTIDDFYGCETWCQV